ncbi:hypothetical protein I8J29_24455 [Paenibacillus sp. MWE-103]|uniref:Uncharacterized protein n=1 Tax=Paenibacillus artemisiicola TaxID=1172618 RepID=A0ABS3WGU5_9BACL|nr:hypothetical protein [Paenibacillus artemisiicola]MBO7747341.1 hypothetical protein [Paenibacillus artemisiicola]
MTTIFSIVKQYSKAIFLDQTRQLSTAPASYQPDVKAYAAGTLEVGGALQPSGLYVETIDDALLAGTITLDQHAEILNLNPDMPRRPQAQTAE